MKVRHQILAMMKCWHDVWHYRSVVLTRPETSGWLVKKEGMLNKSKRGPGFKKSVVKRYFILKVEPISKNAEFEYYEGKTARGSMPLQGAAVKPAVGGAFVCMPYSLLYSNFNTIVCMWLHSFVLFGPDVGAVHVDPHGM